MMNDKIHQFQAIILAAVLVSSVFAGIVMFSDMTIAGNVDDGASSSVSTNTIAEQSEVGFDPNSKFRRIARGDPIRKPYTIEFGNSNIATITITNWSTENGDYRGHVTVKDDGDGVAKLYINTWEMGHSNPFEVKGGTVQHYDQIKYNNESKLINKTKANSYTTYDLLINKGGSSEGARVTDRAGLRVQEAETEEIQTWTAPHNTEINKPSDLWKKQGAFADSRRNFSLEGDTTVAEGDDMVLAPLGGGIFGSAEHAMSVTENDTAALKWIVDNGYYNFTVTQTNAPEGQRKVLNLDRAISVGAVDFVNGLHNYHIVIAVDTDAPIFQRGGSGEFVTAGAGDNFSVAFDKTKRVDHDYTETEDGEIIDEHSPTVYTNIHVVEPTIALNPLPDDSGTNTTISGNTSLAPGTPLRVNVTVGDITQQKTTLVHKETNDNNKHTWNTTVDISGAGDGENIEVTVSAPGYGTIETWTKNETMEAFQ